MRQYLFRSALVGFVGLAATTALGCARWIDVNPGSIVSPESMPQAVPHHERVPFILDGFRLVQNGAAQNPSIDVERRILNQVQETRLFSSLVPLGGPVASPGEKAVTARITFDETIDPHAGDTAWKGFVIGASMFLLSGAIELDYDYAARATLELERWDGQIKHYEARSAGTAHYNLFGATPLMIDELKGQVTETCLNELMDQLVRDTTFYVASSTPMPEGSVRTVTVRARKPLAPPPALSVIPVSTAPVP